MLGVLYPYANQPSQRAGWAYPIYNTQWRGLAKLLISMERQCEGLMTGISKKVSPTSFFVSITIVLTLMPKQGEW